MTLNDFVEEGIRRAQAVGYHPTAFMGMWYPDRSPKVLENLVSTSDPKTGYKRMVREGLKDWTLEAAVVAYPDHFSKKAVEYAKFRLTGALDE
ncbi:MAG: hypothetical protein Q8R81_07010 [Novosphingobium sp.]|uniref:hypothetical protein n=1 Tax=Novosphingobium sp. TaxID=1874826 RepID=UPI002732A45A|nr:hypothetical protein [Novosphingobium sp.]MDP3550128.1 hypothetical protein [Novosphingobium sp.]